MRKLNLIGQTYNKLRVIADTNKKQDRRTIWLCECECGNLTEVNTNNLRRGTTKSCGCLLTDKLKSKEHREKVSKALSKPLRNTITYNKWLSMKNRCKEDPYYKQIKVTDEWVNNFDQFYFDMGECPEGYTLDRINNAEGYTPNNCRWVSHKENCQNRTNTKLTKDDVINIRRLLAEGNLQKDIANKFNVSQAQISAIKSRKTWDNI